MIKTNIDTVEIELTQACVLKCKHCFLNKINGPMTKETFNNTLCYIKDIFNMSCTDHAEIIFTGGEPALTDIDLLVNGVKWLRANINIPIKIYFQTTLVYTLTEKYLNFFRMIDEVSISWDYAVRFNNIHEEAQLFLNIERLKKENIIPHLIVTITDTLVHDVTPAMFMSFIMATGLKSFDFNRFFTPANFTNEKYSLITKAKASELGNWLFEVYKLWDKIKDTLNLFVFDFKGVTDGYKGAHYNQWSKTCPETLIHITSLGKVSNCHGKTNVCFGDVNTKDFNEQLYLDVIKAHHAYYESEECKTCKYFEYCQCGCPSMYHDETGCTIPKKVYEYLRLKEEMGLK